jgi:PKD repeat protein
MQIMKKILSISSFLLVVLSTLLVQCKKDEAMLTGTSSTADFDFLVTPLKDTLPFASVVTFTNKSQGEFLYQWDFGDNTALSSEKNPKHTYATGGEYNVRLTTVGANGNSSITKKIIVIDACANDFFNKLTSCSFNSWTWSSDGDAIRILSPNLSQVFFAGTAASCQADDVYKFYSDGKLEYDAKGQTFDVQSNYTCQAPKANAAKFKVIIKPNQLPRIVLDNVIGATSNPFIGTTDVVENNQYEVVSYSADRMVLRGVVANSGGNRIEIKLKKLVALTLADINNLLSGGSSKTWVLDPAPGAKAIIVGTESNPSQYFGGGTLDACQIDDKYTFSTGNKLTYNASGATFNGGNISPNYNCGSDRSYSNISYTFGAVTGGVAGLASIQLPQTPPTIFVGVTDVPSENVYRIIEISTTNLVLRAGNGSGTVFQMKFIPQ